MQHFCQGTLLLLVVVSFIRLLYVDFNGRAEQEPMGFVGGLISIAATLTWIALLYGAGALSLIFGR